MSWTLNGSDMLRTLNTLSSVSAQLALSNARLATGKRINQAMDDPAGIVAIASLDQRLAEIDAAGRNGERINSIIDTADGALSQISSLLGTIQSNALSAAGASVTAEERGAYQAEIDAAVDAIDTLVNTTTFNGVRLLDGGTGYNTSGVDTAKLADVRVNSADTAAGTISLEVALAAAAEKAVISYSDGNLTDDVTFSLTGNNGTVQFTLASGSTISNIETAVNAQSDSTGVVAEADGGTLYFRSSEYGSSQSVQINVTDGTFDMDGSVTSDTGGDATVTVNGLTTTADGLQVYFSSGSTSVRFSLTESFGTGAPASTTFSITSGGAGWQLDANPINRIHYGLTSLNSAYLGNDSVGYLRSIKSGGANDLASGNYHQASNIASAASLHVATERARLGAIQSYTVNSTLSSLSAASTAHAQAKSRIEDIDYAEETANNNRLQLLMQMGTTLLSMMNQNRSQILNLLG
ncbi:MAG: flagellin [Sedimentisphaerales bacterium]|nr:flagellin [Sedimentisphaerales bacterium]